MTALDFRHVRFAWRPQRDAPRWWQALLWILRSVIVVYAVATVAIFGWTAAKGYLIIPAEFRGETVRLIAGVLFLVLLLFFTARVGTELFRAQDLTLFVTMPLDDRRRFHRKLGPVVREGLQLAALMFVFLSGFSAKLHRPWWSYAGSAGTTLLVVAVLIALATLIALARPLQLLVRLALWSTLPYAVYLSAGDRFSGLLIRPHWPLDYWWPGALAGDLLRFIGSGSWLFAAIAAAKLVLIAQLAFLAAEALVPFRYRLEHVLGEQEEHFVARLAGKPAEPARDPLAKALRARWSARTQALLAFIQRREDVTAIWPRVKVFLIQMAGVIALAHLWYAAGSRFGWKEEVLITGTIPLVTVIAYHLLRDLAHQPGGLRQTMSLAERGNHENPLIETLPIGVREFTRLLLWSDFVTLAFYTAATLLASALAPFRFTIAAIVTVSFFCPIVLLITIGPPQHASSYRTDPRRRRLLVILKMLAVITLILLGFLLSGVLGASLIASHVNPINVLIAFFAVFMSVPFIITAISYALLFSRDREHRFDCEYDSLRLPRWARW